jgi:hypothetical protein
MLFVCERKSTTNTCTPTNDYLLRVPPLLVITEQTRHYMVGRRHTIERMPNLMGQIRMIEMIDFSERTFHKRLSKAIVARGLRSGSMFSSSATKTEESPANPPPRVDSPSDIAPGESLSLPNAP